MNTKVFCLASPKGGSGKTMITASLAAFLAALNKQSLLVDCDASTHGLTLLHIEEVASNKRGQGKIAKGVFDSGFELDEEGSNIVNIRKGVDFIPATYSFKLLNHVDENGFSKNIRDIISYSQGKYDFVFLDAQAGSDVISREVMKSDVSGEVIIVSEYDPMSAAGTERLKNIVGEDLEYSRTWVLLNKMLPEFVEKFEDFMVVSKYLPPIPWNVDVVKAYATRQLAIDMEFGNEYTVAIMQMLKTLLGGEVASEIVRWASGRATFLSQPFAEQYEDAKDELLMLVEYNRRMVRRSRYRKLIFTANITVAVFCLCYFLIKYYWGGEFVDFMFSRPSSLIFIGSVAALCYGFVNLYDEFYGHKSADQVGVDKKIYEVEAKLERLNKLKFADFRTLARQKDSFK